MIRAYFENLLGIILAILVVLGLGFMVTSMVLATFGILAMLLSPLGVNAIEWNWFSRLSFIAYLPSIALLMTLNEFGR